MITQTVSTAESTSRDDRRDMFWFMGVPLAVVGWVFFVAMAALKISGATIYATTDQGMIEAIDPVWERSCREAFSEGAGRSRLAIRVGGQ